MLGSQRSKFIAWHYLNMASKNLGFLHILLQTGGKVSVSLEFVTTTVTLEGYLPHCKKQLVMCMACETVSMQ